MPRGEDDHFLLLKLPDLPGPGAEGWDGPEGWKLLDGGESPDGKFAGTSPNRDYISWLQTHLASCHGPMAPV